MNFRKVFPDAGFVQFTIEISKSYENGIYSIYISLNREFYKLSNGICTQIFTIFLAGQNNEKVDRGIGSRYKLNHTHAHTQRNVCTFKFLAREPKNISTCGLLHSLRYKILFPMVYK